MTEAAQYARLKELKMQFEESSELKDFLMMARIQLEMDSIQSETSVDSDASRLTVTDNELIKDEPTSERIERVGLDVSTKARWIEWMWH